VAIVGIGIDLTEVGRVRRLLARHPGFAVRCFTDLEREYAFGRALPEEHLAARFAAKEAVMKSLGAGWRGVHWQDVEITGGGAPRVVLRGRAAARAEALGVAEVLVSLTYTGDLAAAVAVAAGE